jgi:hypothetical protein
VLAIQIPERWSNHLYLTSIRGRVNHPDDFSSLWYVNGPSGIRHVFLLSGPPVIGPIQPARGGRVRRIYDGETHQLDSRGAGVPDGRHDGNIFSGEGHYYYIGSGLSAGPVKRLVLDPNDLTTVGYFQG